MFRRKKSTQDAPHHSISISAPMRMAPPSQIAQTTSPVFDKFAKTTPRPNGGWMNPSNVYPEDPNQFVQTTPTRVEDKTRAVSRERRMSSRPGLGIFDGGGILNPTKQQKQQQMTSADASLLDSRQTGPQPPKKPEKDTRHFQNISEKRNSRLPTPPSPSSKPSARQLPTVNNAGNEMPPINPRNRSALEAPSPWTTSPHSPSTSAFLSSNQGTPSPVTPVSPITPQTPQINESGFLNPEIRKANEPSLGNSLEARRAPKRGKYSPLAAFGPGPSPSSSPTSPTSAAPIGKMMDATSTQGALKPTSQFTNVSDRTYKAHDGYSPNITPRDLRPDQGFQTRSSEDTQSSFNDKHVSMQPLKTASVELRVGYDVEEQEFHSPLFAAVPPTNQDPPSRRSRHEAEEETRGRQRSSARSSLYYNHNAESNLRNRMNDIEHNAYAPMLNSSHIDRARHNADEDRLRPVSTLGRGRDGSTAREWAGRPRIEGWEEKRTEGEDAEVEGTEIREEDVRELTRSTFRDQESALKARTRSKNGRTRAPTDTTLAQCASNSLDMLSVRPSSPPSSSILTHPPTHPPIPSGSNSGSLPAQSQIRENPEAINISTMKVSANDSEIPTREGISSSSGINNSLWQRDEYGREGSSTQTPNDGPQLQRSHSQRARERVREREKEMERERQRLRSRERHQQSSDDTFEPEVRYPSSHQTPIKAQAHTLDQLPTPPTSIDGHLPLQLNNINDGSFSRNHPNATIASILEANNDLIGAARERLRMIGSGEGTPHDVVDPSLAQLRQIDGIQPMQADVLNGASDVTHGFTPGMTSPPPISRGPSISSSFQSSTIRPSVQTANLNPTFQGIPLSPPQSPPQTRTLMSPGPSSIQSQRTRSKSRTRRPGTGSSVQSQKEGISSKDGYNYKPPSSASSVDGQRSASLTGSFGRRLQKSSSSRPHVQTLVESPVDMFGSIEGDGIASELVDSDPFAKGEVERTDSCSVHSHSSHPSRPTTAQSRDAPPLPRPSTANSMSAPTEVNSNKKSVSSSPVRRTRREGRLDNQSREAALAHERVLVVEEEDNQDTEKEEMQEPEPQPKPEPEPEKEPTFYPLEKHLSNVQLFCTLLPYLDFRDWCSLIAVNDGLRRSIEHRRDLREAVLEHFLVTVGYTRWRWDTKEHVMLTFRDLNSYMRGVSVPSHQFSKCAQVWINARSQAQAAPDDEYLRFKAKSAASQKSLLSSSCRAYTRVVLRLRAQAEAMERDYETENMMNPIYQFTPPQSTTSVNAKASGRRSASRARTASRPPSPTTSANSHSAFSHARNGSSHARSNRAGNRFRSPLFQLGHAPVLRVFVANPEGSWLTDDNVIECEKELKRAGVIPLMRVGDVVWDTAVGDEGNIGRLVWDGNYLIDLDYTYSRSGEVPQYLHTLSFPPSYFHRVIRSSGNPICYIDISPWAEEIAANLQLLQDRVKAETPQGGRHMVVRWVHRSKFHIRPNPYTNEPIPIPSTSLSVDPGWFGTIIVEAEGTNEGLADLQARCKRGFPPRAVGAEVHAVNGHVNGSAPKKGQGKVYRLLRERSRPGEIWLRTVREKERLL